MGRLGQVRSDHVDMALSAGPAHGHIGQLPSASVLQHIADIHGAALGPVAGDGMAMGQLVGADLVGTHAQLGPHGGDCCQRTRRRVNRADRGPLRGDPRPVWPPGPG
jgi:hypothetical protein